MAALEKSHFDSLGLSMRRAAFASAVCLLGFSSAVAFAQQAGDRIVTMRDATVRSTVTATGSVPKCSILDVDAAIEWQTKALGIASEKAKPELLSRLELHKARKPYGREAK
jgi:hypothetical protein